MLSVDGVHRREIVHALQKNRAAHNIFQLGPRSIQYPRDILHLPLGLGRNITGDDLLRRWINGDLPRSKNQSVGFGRLRVRADGLGSVGSGDNSSHGVLFCFAQSPRVLKRRPALTMNRDYSGLAG